MSVTRAGMTKRCVICTAEFYVRPSLAHARYCSRACHGVSMKTSRKVSGNPNFRGTFIQQNCPVCDTQFGSYSGQVHCSRKCRFVALTGNVFASKQKLCKGCGAAFLGHTGQRWCETCKTRQCVECQGVFVVEPSRRKVTCSPQCKQAWMIKINTGPLSPLWKGGISSQTQKDRVTAPYRDWRLMVYQLDGFRCVLCDKGSRLTAHHIRMWSQVPELRFEPSNGVTLCWECHGQLRHHEQEFEVLFAEVVTSRGQVAA